MTYNLGNVKNREITLIHEYISRISKSVWVVFWTLEHIALGVGLPCRDWRHRAGPLLTALHRAGPGRLLVGWCRRGGLKEAGPTSLRGLVSWLRTCRMRHKLLGGGKKSILWKQVNTYIIRDVNCSQSTMVWFKNVLLQIVIVKTLFRAG